MSMECNPWLKGGELWEHCVSQSYEDATSTNLLAARPDFGNTVGLLGEHEGPGWVGEIVRGGDTVQVVWNSGLDRDD